MKIKMTKEMAEAVGFDNLEIFGLEEYSFAYGKTKAIDLTEYTLAVTKDLAALLKPHMKVRGVKPALRDIGIWVSIVENKDQVKPRSVEHFETVLKKFLEDKPGHRLYSKNEEFNTVDCYYANFITYHPADKKHDIPAKVVLHLLHIEFGARQSSGITFQEEDCVGISPEEALAYQGFYVETEELRKQYVDLVERYTANVNEVGKQFYATGTGTDNLDGNPSGDDDSRWWRRTNTIPLDRGGEPARVVMDVYSEEGKSADNDRESNVKLDFWKVKNYLSPKKKKLTSGDDDDEEIEDDDSSDEETEGKLPEGTEIPLHPMVPVFDLKRHLRMRVHINQLTEYKYDPKLGEKLVLPEEVHDLVEMLLAHKGGWKDIIGGKGGGAIILCSGKPGTGKTLTAEVYSEVMKRPLYSVQASQLGMTPEELEQELLLVFARARRWNAILLLDEADVYVAQRGSDLTQNAIVGVFLRVLEYYHGVLFLTTNRSDLVDDAVASRCVARIDYEPPKPEAQKKIWKILSTTAGVDLSDKLIDSIVEAFPGLSGRDVKNLLKLSSLVSSSQGKPIDLKTIKFVKRFKPTAD